MDNVFTPGLRRTNDISELLAKGEVVILLKTRTPVEVNCRDGRGWIMVTRYILHWNRTITWWDYWTRSKCTTDDWRKVNRES